VQESELKTGKTGAINETGMSGGFDGNGKTGSESVCGTVGLTLL
jgi:hypothetical protein